MQLIGLRERTRLLPGFYDSDEKVNRLLEVLCCDNFDMVGPVTFIFTLLSACVHSRSGVDLES